MMDDAIKMAQIHKNCNGLAGQPQLKALSAILQHRDTDHNPPLNHLFGNGVNILVHQVITKTENVPKIMKLQNWNHIWFTGLQDLARVYEEAAGGTNGHLDFRLWQLLGR